MSATCGYSENIYSLGVLPLVTQRRRHEDACENAAILSSHCDGVAFVNRRRIARRSLHNAQRDPAPQAAALILKAERSRRIKITQFEKCLLRAIPVRLITSSRHVIPSQCAQPPPHRQPVYQNDGT